MIKKIAEVLECPVGYLGALIAKEEIEPHDYLKPRSLQVVIWKTMPVGSPARVHLSKSIGSRLSRNSTSGKRS